jgi:hypothetical protein
VKDGEREQRIARVTHDVGIPAVLLDVILDGV